MSRKPSYKPYTGPSGGWGSARSLGAILAREGVCSASGSLALTRQNKVDGFQCVSCAWVKPARPLPFEFCENGAKATAWEITAHRCTPDFFAQPYRDRTARLGRLPSRTSRAADASDALRCGIGHDMCRCPGMHAIADIGQKLRAESDDRKSVVFYSSGRCSNEASYLYALFARVYGNNNLPDSSNMCHETTSVALPESIGVPVGTVPWTISPRPTASCSSARIPAATARACCILLQAASKRGVPIIVYNPLRERGLERFTNPQSPTEMLTGQSKRGSASQYNQVKAGGDLAALTGICKAVLALDARGRGLRRSTRPGPRVHCRAHARVRHDFIAWLHRRRTGREHRTRIGSFARGAWRRPRPSMPVRKRDDRDLWHGADAASRRRGNHSDARQSAADARQYRARAGAGICPVRGHSNVQGQRTVGITEKPKLVPLDKLAAAVRVRATAGYRAQHGGGLRGDPRRDDRGVRDAGRQFRARHSRSRPHGAGLASHAADGECRDEAQPQSSPARGRSATSCRYWDESRSTGRRAGRRRSVDGGQHRPYPRVARRARAGLAASDQRESRRRLRTGESDLRRTPSVPWDAWRDDYAG